MLLETIDSFVSRQLTKNTAFTSGISKDFRVSYSWIETYAVIKTLVFEKQLTSFCKNNFLDFVALFCLLYEVRKRFISFLVSEKNNILLKVYILQKISAAKFKKNLSTMRSFDPRKDFYPLWVYYGAHTVIFIMWDLLLSLTQFQLLLSPQRFPFH